MRINNSRIELKTIGPVKVSCEGQKVLIETPTFDLSRESWEDIFNPLVERRIKKILREVEEMEENEEHDDFFNQFQLSNDNLLILSIMVDEIKFWLRYKGIYKGVINYPRMYDGIAKLAILQSPRIELEKISDTDEGFSEKKSLLTQHS